jgi:hypothetical protein
LFHQRVFAPITERSVGYLHLYSFVIVVAKKKSQHANGCNELDKALSKAAKDCGLQTTGNCRVAFIQCAWPQFMKSIFNLVIPYYLCGITGGFVYCSATTELINVENSLSAFRVLLVQHF